MRIKQKNYKKKCKIILISYPEEYSNQEYINFYSYGYCRDYIEKQLKVRKRTVSKSAEQVIFQYGLDTGLISGPH